MRITIVSIFPEFFASPLATSLVGKAMAEGHIEIEHVDPRDHAEGVHRQVDDAPYGGGAGMVMMVEPMAKALEPLATSHRIFFTPAGHPLEQADLDRLSGLDHITLVCGRYEGFDERIAQGLNPLEVSVGDFICNGGEVPAMLLIDAVIRLIPGVLGDETSHKYDSFSQSGMLEYPQYTRPREFRGMAVPEILLSGNHPEIARWREEQSRKRTAERRSDLLENG